MCGVIGLLLRDPGLEPELGSLLVPMLEALDERGPDSSGIALYADHAAGAIDGDSLPCASRSGPTSRWTGWRVGCALLDLCPAGADVQRFGRRCRARCARARARRRARLPGRRSGPRCGCSAPAGTCGCSRTPAGPPTPAPATACATGRATWPSPTPAWPPSRPSPCSTRTPSCPTATSASCTTAPSRTTPPCAGGCRTRASCSTRTTTRRSAAASSPPAWPLGDDLEEATRWVMKEMDGFFTLVITSAEWHVGRARRLRLQAGRGGRDARLRGGGLGVPGPGRAPRHRRRRRLRAPPRGGLHVDTLKPVRTSAPSDCDDLGTRAVNQALRRPARGAAARVGAPGAATTWPSASPPRRRHGRGQRRLLPRRALRHQGRRPGPTSPSTASSAGRWARTSWAAPSGSGQRLAERGGQRPRRPHRRRGSTPPARRDLAQGRHRGHRRRRRRHDRLHGPGRHHPHRGRRRPRPGGLALRGGHLRARAPSRRSAPTPWSRRWPTTTSSRSSSWSSRQRVRPHRARPGHQGGLGPPAVPLRHPQPRAPTESRCPNPTGRPVHPENHSFPPDVIARIHEMADTGHYPIRGLGARRKLPTFDDLVFLTASVTPLPARGLPGALRHRDRARHPPRRQADSSSTSRSPSPA